MFTLDMLPANDGDCLVLTYGKGDGLRRILVDGGRTDTHKALQAYMDYRKIPYDERVFELMVITHIDEDHLNGVPNILAKRKGGPSFKEVWFNGDIHLNLPPVGAVDYGPSAVSELLRSMKDTRWNERFQGECVMCGAEKIELDGGLELSVISPNAENITALAEKWYDELVERGYICLRAEEVTMAPPPPPPGPQPLTPSLVRQLAGIETDCDDSPSNASSIAMIAKYEGNSVLLAGDAVEETMLSSLPKKLAVDAFKLPHHGSARNNSLTLLERVDARKYLISSCGTNDDRPSDLTLSRIAAHHGTDADIVFNYRSEFTERWDAADLEEEFGYRSHYPTVETAIDLQD